MVYASGTDSLIMSCSQLLAGTCMCPSCVYIPNFPNLCIASSQEWLQNKKYKNFLFLPKVAGPAVICESNEYSSLFFQ